MKKSLSVLILTQNSEEIIEKTLDSIVDWVDEIVVVDNYSTDNTINQILNIKNQNDKLKLKILKKHYEDIGEQRAFGLKECSGSWVLILDSDEEVSKELAKEIVKLLYCYIIRENAFWLPFQNYYLGRRLHYGGENYEQLRLFKRNAFKILPSLIHNKFEIKDNKVGHLKGKIIHHSYRSIGQVFKKFTDYGIRMAKEKGAAGERSSLKKIFFYPVHMFYARFIKDKGYRDSIFRIPLDIGFAYMEFLTYLLLLFKTRL